MMSRWGSWTWCWYLLIASQDLGNSLPLQWVGFQDRLLLDKIQHFTGGDALAISVFFLSFKHPNWVRDVVLQLYVPNEYDMFELEIFICRLKGMFQYRLQLLRHFIWICVNQFAHSIEVHSVYFKGVGQSHLARSRPTCWLTLQDIKGVWPKITEIEWQKWWKSDGFTGFSYPLSNFRRCIDFKLCYPLAWLRYIEIRLNFPPLLVFLWGSKVERAFDSSYHEGTTK